MSTLRVDNIKSRTGTTVTIPETNTLAVTGIVSVTSTGSITNAGSLTNSGNVNITGGITTVGGSATISGNVFISGITTISGNLVNTGTFTQSGTFSPTNINTSGIITCNGLTVNGTQTIVNTTSLEVKDKNIGIGSTSSPSDALADGAGITIYGTTDKTLTWSNTTKNWTFVGGGVTVSDLSVSGIATIATSLDLKGAVETVSTGSTYDLGGGRVILECDARNGTVFTHDLANGIVGITSLKNFPVTKNSATTFTILFTQNATGTANTTAATGIGTNIRLTPYGVSGFTTTSKVATASTITLSTTALDVDIVSFMVHYNGSGTGTVSNYKVYVTNNTGFRYGSVGF